MTENVTAKGTISDSWYRTPTRRGSDRVPDSTDVLDRATHYVGWLVPVANRSGFYTAVVLRALRVCGEMVFSTFITTKNTENHRD